MNVIFIILIGILFASSGQILWKIGMTDVGQVTSLTVPTLLSMAFNPFVFTGLVCYALSSVFWLIALSRADLSFVYPFIALTFVIIFIASAFMFHEAIGVTRIVGAAVIILGIIILVRG